MSERVIRSRAERMAGYRRVLDARDPATAPDRLHELSTDPIRPVRLFVARNLSAPQDALVRLASDEDSSVRWNVLHNPRLPTAGLRKLADGENAELGDKYFVIRSRVMAHPNCSDDLRRDLERRGARVDPIAMSIFARMRGRAGRQ